MRSKVPCTVCRKTSSLSGFVFQSSPSKGVCRPCYNRKKRFEKVTAAREASTSDRQNEKVGVEKETAQPPSVINLRGMFPNVYMNL